MSDVKRMHDPGRKRYLALVAHIQEGSHSVRKPKELSWRGHMQAVALSHPAYLEGRGRDAYKQAAQIVLRAELVAKVAKANPSPSKQVGPAKPKGG